MFIKKNQRNKKRVQLEASKRSPILELISLKHAYNRVLVGSGPLVLVYWNRTKKSFVGTM